MDVSLDDGATWSNVVSGLPRSIPSYTVTIQVPAVVNYWSVRTSFTDSAAVVEIVWDRVNMTDVGSPVEYVNISAQRNGVIFSSLCYGILTIYIFFHFIITSSSLRLSSDTFRSLEVSPGHYIFSIFAQCYW